MKNSFLIILVILLISKSETSTNLRNLLPYQNFEKTITINTLNFLEQQIKIEERFANKGGNFAAQIIITTDSGSAVFGRDDLTFPSRKSFFVMLPFMKLSIPEVPDVILILNGVAKIHYQFDNNFDSDTSTHLIVKGSIYAKVDYAFGGHYPTLAASAKGAIINIDTDVIFYPDSRGIKKIIDNSKGDKIAIHLTGKNVDDIKFIKDHDIWNGWTSQYN